MVCFIKSVETFATIGQYDVSDYTVPLGSANGATGGITVAATLTQDYTRQWLIMGGHLFYIVSVNPDEGMTEITVGDPLTAFSRTLVYEEPTTNILGEYIRALMTSEYISLSDTAYDMPYLSVTNSDTTEFAHVYPKDGLFTLESVMRDAQSRGIRIEFTYTNNGIACTISPGDTTVHPLIVGDGHTQLASETYDRTAIAKVTVISVLGYPHDYYLAVDGTVTTTVPVNRAQGEWITVKQGEDNLYDTALAAFAQNLESHKVTLYSDAELELYASVGIRLNDAVYSSRITYVGISAKDDRYIYNCGDMAVTLVDKIRSISAAAETGAVSKLSELQNDVGYITAGEAPVQSVNGNTGAVTVTVPTSVSQLTNDAGYVTSAITAVSTGDWTPTISRSGGVTKTSATYVKSGHTVHLAATITVTAGSVSSSAYFDASCLPFTPSSTGAVFGTMSNTSSHASYALMANPGVNNNVWICGASGGVAGNAISGTFAVHLSYITNS